MPYNLRKVKGGYKVGHKGKSKTYSKKPMTRQGALAQLRALYANTDESFDARLRAALILLETNAPVDDSEEMLAQLTQQLDAHRQHIEITDINLTIETDRREDPAPEVHVGGRGPIPSHDYAAGIRGHVKFETPAEVAQLLEQYHEVTGDWPGWVFEQANAAAKEELGHSVRVTSWDATLHGEQLILTPSGIDAANWRADDWF